MSYKEGGYIIITAPGDYVAKEISTWNCCHCNRIVHSRPGSGIQRGYCFNCNATHCGGEKCWECKPFEKWLDQQEGTSTLKKYLGI